WPAVATASTAKHLCNLSVTTPPKGCAVSRNDATSGESAPMRVFTQARWAAILIVAGTVAGCTGQPAAPRETITIGYSAWPGWFPWQVAQQQGMFAKYG